jgi:hypothetical protein
MSSIIDAPMINVVGLKPTLVVFPLCKQPKQEQRVITNNLAEHGVTFLHLATIDGILQESLETAMGIKPTYVCFAGSYLFNRFHRLQKLLTL